MRLFPLVLLIAACGANDDAGDAAKDAGNVAAAGNASGALPADASTADAMSVDVAAGGVQPMVDPATAAAEAQAAAQAEPATTPAADTPATPPKPVQ